MTTTNCPFCDPQAAGNQLIAEIGTMQIWYPQRPIIETHVLIMPYRHIEQPHEMTEQEMLDTRASILTLQKRLSEKGLISGYNLHVNAGRDAGQEVLHLHWHFYGRSKDEPVDPFQALAVGGHMEQLSLPQLREKAELFKQYLNI